MPGGIDPSQAAELFTIHPEAFTTGRSVPVPANPSRRPFNSADFLRANHLTAADYVFDSGAVRFVFLDTACPGGGADGCVDSGQLEWLQAQLDDAGQRWVVLVSHHGLETLTNGRPHGDGAGPPVSAELLLATLSRSPKLVLWLNGHIHANRVRPRSTFWEVTTSSLVDWPCQARLVELVEVSGGRLAIACTMVDHGSPVEPGDADSSARLAALHRELAGNVPGQGFESRRAGDQLDRNVILLR
jgi:hypothetical protein